MSKVKQSERNLIRQNKLGLSRMKKILVSPLGIFGLEGATLTPLLTFENDEHAAEVLAGIRLEDPERVPLDQLKEILGEDEIQTHVPGLSRLLKSIGLEAKEVSDDEGLIAAIKGKPGLMVQAGIVASQQEYYSLLHERGLLTTGKLLQSATTGRDKLVIQAILFLDDLDKMTNLAVVRIREWYGLHFPELDRKVENHATYCRLVAFVGPRDRYDYDSFEQLNLPQSKIDQLVDLARVSSGTELKEEDWKPLRDLAKETLNLMEQRKKVEDWIDSVMSDVAPNLKALAGSLVAARLIAMAGSLEDLAKKPASKIQVLGAEKALYRSLRTGTAPPKHGVIFQIPLIGKSPWWIRGKLARFVAAKLAIAARLDAFGGEFLGDVLNQQVHDRLEELRKEFPQAPEGKKAIKVFPKGSFNAKGFSRKDQPKRHGHPGKGGKGRKRPHGKRKFKRKK